MTNEQISGELTSTPDERGLLYADVVALEAHVDSLTADCRSYRELAQQALQYVSELAAHIRKLDARIKDQERQIRQLMGLGDGRDDDDATT